MPFSRSKIEAAYPKVRVYAATRDLIRQLCEERGDSVMAVMRDAVEALLKASGQPGTPGASSPARPRSRR